MPVGDGLGGGKAYNVCTDDSFNTFASTVKQKDNGVDLQQSIANAVSSWNQTLGSQSTPNALSFVYPPDTSKPCDVTISASQKPCSTGNCEGAEWDPNNQDGSTPSTSGQIVWNTVLNYPSQADADDIFGHEFGHAAGLADANSQNSFCSPTDTVMWYQEGAESEACGPTYCDQNTEAQDVYNCSASGPPSCPSGSAPACENNQWYCDTEACTDVCDPNCSDYDPSDPSCGDGCYDICDPSCVNYDPSDPSCGGGCYDVCDPSCVNYDPSDPSCGGGCYDECDPACVNYDPSLCGGGGGGGGGGGCDDPDYCELDAVNPIIAHSLSLPVGIGFALSMPAVVILMKRKSRRSDGPEK